MLGNKNLILFIGVGFFVTVLIWGFVGGCGTTNVHKNAVEKRASEADGLIFEETVIPEDVTVYVVEAGDTLWAISREVGVPVSEIKKANNLNQDTISVGQRLIIPGKVRSVTGSKRGKSVPVKSAVPVDLRAKTLIPKGDLVVYTVRKGDSLWRIAQIHGVSVQRIAELNGISKDARLKPGQELLVPKEK